MEIVRINEYDDERFSKEILEQHGAFLVDEKYKYEFKIISKDSVVVYFQKIDYINEVIDEFRFYSEFITKFFDEKGNLIKKFEDVKLLKIYIKDIIPSQFYVDELKENKVSTFINKEEDIIIPLAKINGEFVSLDGHTRLYAGIDKGFKFVLGYITEAGEYINDFVEEAKRRNIKSPYDLIKLNHDEYELRWHKFCEDYFSMGDSKN